MEMPFSQFLQEHKEPFEALFHKKAEEEPALFLSYLQTLTLFHLYPIIFNGQNRTPQADVQVRYELDRIGNFLESIHKNITKTSDNTLDMQEFNKKP